MTPNIRIAAIAFVMVSCAWNAMAQLSRQDRDQMNKMIQGDLYLRNNVPCRYTSGGFGIGAEVVAEVSPTGVDWDKNLAAIAEKKQKRGVDTIYWGFVPNDIIRYGKLYFKNNDVIELWAEGAKPKNTEIWIRFVQIKSLDDFKKAFDLILANKPLQDEHPEWPEEIRRAIAARNVVEGMTKAQAFMIVGTPIGVEEGEKDGKKTETWFPRQDTGAAASWGKVASTETGFPISLQFSDGKVVNIVRKSGSVKIDIKK
jgi:hypothetical protein